MRTIEILFWVFLFVVFYTFIGYGMLLYLAVKIKESLHKNNPAVPCSELPDITLFITAYNEESVVDEKMKNSTELNYPKDKLHIVWVTDGSNDKTNDLLKKWDNVTVYFQPERKGKMAAMNRGIQLVHTPIVVFTDANTYLNREAINEIIKPFEDPKVGCVAGEKRIVASDRQDAAQGGEGIYWKYESALKDLDSRLYSTIGTAGELFAIRRELYREIEADTLLDDFVLSLRIAMDGYKIAYCKSAYAIEGGSSDMQEEEKRKVRIAAGGLQATWRLRALFNPFRYKTLHFQFLSHRVLRWTITPLLLFLLLPLNLVIVFWGPASMLYSTIFILQVLFYITAFIGYMLQRHQLKIKAFFIPYYFLFMNMNVFKGIAYLCNHHGSGTWSKSNRKNISSHE